MTKHAVRVHTKRYEHDAAWDDDVRPRGPHHGQEGHIAGFAIGPDGSERAFVVLNNGVVASFSLGELEGVMSHD